MTRPEPLPTWSSPLHRRKPLRLSLFGAPGTNTNLGLNALMTATLEAALVVEQDAHVTVFDGLYGSRTAQLPQGQPYALQGVRLSRRIHRPESYAAMNASRLWGGWGNAGMRAVLTSDAVLDVSGGDSFSDIYGAARFRTVCAPKRLALDAGRPLVLLPQTYGPFSSSRTANEARGLTLRARAAWARDDDSHVALQELLGQDFDPERHRVGVDLAVLLRQRRPRDLPDPVVALLEDDERPVAVNVSGLLWRQAPSFVGIDYRRAMLDLTVRLLRAGRRVVLVPHVLGRRLDGEADNVAGTALAAEVPSALQSGLLHVRWLETAAEAKWIIARSDWLLGTRMHATIGALSAGVPCAAVSYSPKYAGVFAGFGVRELALDARTTSTDGLVEAAWQAYEERDVTRARLRDAAPAVQEKAREQMEQILEMCRA